MTDLLHCTGIQCRFGDFIATKGIDLSVKHGEIVGIIGANGAGKTTLLNIISGYLKPTAGRVMFRGTDVTGMPPRALARRGIARSFQVPQLFASGTARENMMVALSLLVDPRSALLRRFSDRGLFDKAQRLLEDYRIGEHADAVVAHIPQGVRKLLDIAMATCASPALVLLDEPTSGVSVDEKNDLISRLIERLRKTSTSVIFIEHDMEIVREYASRVIALYDGRIIADGDVAEVFADRDVVRYITGAGVAPLSADGCHAPA
ncbi:ABC transporter ATP-binding protein [Bradyrhizobium sp. Arg237L]|uniref:ABC transporter ATP-binding protein n=1 Tax=Bradyrhizobium sp. Arg237L TaxID=3003352 RepID=UPI00249EEA20|nr:ABC transporter ATP-binding protein [Bradyrhizobium sp. Arg237L]MDI4237139.1 ABC transporter ATP-binding protein [Bradyrhizobium sp. Arg237L]